MALSKWQGLDSLCWAVIWQNCHTWLWRAISYSAASVFLLGADVWEYVDKNTLLYTDSTERFSTTTSKTTSPLQNWSRQCSVHIAVAVWIILHLFSLVLILFQWGMMLPWLSLFFVFSSQKHLQSWPLKAAHVSSDVFHNDFFTLTSSELCITSLIGIPTNESTLGWILNKIERLLQTPPQSLSPHCLTNTQLRVWIVFILILL